MPPQTLPNLYCVPSDLFDLLGVEAVQLRLDDPQVGTGQTITVTQDALQAATALSIAPLIYPLLRGTTLELLGAGTNPVTEVVLSATAQVGATSLSIGAAPGPILANSSAKDFGVNLATAARLAKACTYGTTRVKLWCCAKYQDSDLATCWSANRWAAAEAALWLCRRRGNPAPSAVEGEIKDARDEMKLVNGGQLRIEDIGTRNPAWPFISNVTVDIRYDIAKVRAQPGISEGTPTIYPQIVDWDDILSLNWFMY